MPPPRVQAEVCTRDQTEQRQREGNGSKAGREHPHNGDGSYGHREGSTPPRKGVRPACTPRSGSVAPPSLGYDQTRQCKSGRSGRLPAGWGQVGLHCHRLQIRPAVHSWRL